MASQPVILVSKPPFARRPSLCRRSYIAHKPHSPPPRTSRFHLISPHAVSLARKLPYLPEGSLTEKLPRVVFVFGSGNGTRRANFLQHFGFTHLDAGDLLQAEIESGYGIGTMIQHMIKEGKIAPAEVSIKLLKIATLESGNDKFLLNGFPLNEESRAAFLAVTKIEPESVLLFDCSVEEMERRVLSRSQGSEDDDVEAKRKRFEAFLESSLPVIEHHNSRGNVRKIDARKPIGEAFEAVKTVFPPKAEKIMRHTCIFLEASFAVKITERNETMVGWIIFTSSDNDICLFNAVCSC